MSQIEIVFGPHGVGHAQDEKEIMVNVPLSQLPSENNVADYAIFIKKIFNDNGLSKKFASPVVKYAIRLAGDPELNNGLLRRDTGEKFFPQN
mgnify:CR=1 FL=1